MPNDCKLFLHLGAIVCRRLTWNVLTRIQISILWHMSHSTPNDQRKQCVLCPYSTSIYTETAIFPKVWPIKGLVSREHKSQCFPLVPVWQEVFFLNKSNVKEHKTTIWFIDYMILRQFPCFALLIFLYYKCYIVCSNITQHPLGQWEEREEGLWHLLYN